MAIMRAEACLKTLKALFVNGFYVPFIELFNSESFYSI